MEFFDAIRLCDESTRRRTADGYLVARGLAARSGVQVYRGSEVGRPNMDLVRVYRPETEIFARDSLATYAFKPVTNDHPSVAVTADNWREHAVGYVGGEVVRDGEHIVVPLMLADASVIAAVEAGKQELSAGYSTQLDWTPGTTPDGEQYDAVQREIRINHVAVVDAGRAGPSARIADAATNPQPSQQQERSMTDANRVSLVVDGLTVSLAAQDAQIVQRHIESLTARLADAEKKARDMEEEKRKDDEEHEKAMAKRDAAIDDLKSKVLSDADLDARVQRRADLVATARRLVGDAIKPEGKSDADIRRAVVAAKIGDEAIADKSDVYIEARFDAIADAASDPIRDAARGSATVVRMGDRDAARQEYIASLTKRGA